MRSALAASLALCACAAFAQPTTDPAQAARAVDPFVYMMDAAGHRVLVSTHFWRNDPKYDERAFARFIETLAQIEKRGFLKSDKATIDSWDKPAAYARCYVYLEDTQAGRPAKGAAASGARVWCAGSGLSEVEVRNSDSPKHVSEVLGRFDTMVDKARKALAAGPR